MQSDVVRLYGKQDLRRETIDIGSVQAGEVIVDIVCTAVCSSCHKVAVLGAEHSRVPKNLADHPIILGHEFSGIITHVGANVDTALIGKAIIVQPMVYAKGHEWEAMGHSFETAGGYATTIRVPHQFLDLNGIIPWHGNGWYKAALAEPLACIIAAFRTQYHTRHSSFKPVYGMKPDGITLFLGGAGNMGHLAVQLWLQKADAKGLLILYDRNRKKLRPIEKVWGKDPRIKIIYAGEAGEAQLRQMAGSVDDVVVFAPSRDLVDLGLSMLNFDGCLNFFAGPFEQEFTVPVNFHHIHYDRHHIVGSSGASGEDLRRALQLIEEGSVEPSTLVSHVGGLDAAAETVWHLPELGGGKKLIYPSLSLPLTAVSDFSSLAKKDPRYLAVALAIVESNGCWSPAAEQALLSL